MPRHLDFEYILTPGGIERHRRIFIDDAGLISAIGNAPGEAFDGWFALPGMANAHSHSFQRAMVGYGETRCGADSFWSWREHMYRLASLIGPDDLYAIACQAYADMLTAGFTSVGEFHYLHHLPDGSRSTAMGQAVIDAARDVGIRMVFLPAYYHSGGFAEPAGPGQQRFLHESVSEFAAYLEKFSGQRCGIAPHSLRAVPHKELVALIRAADSIFGTDCPIHLHIAEQQAEVDGCMAQYGETPIRLLAGEVDLNPRWQLVHATHADEEERGLIVQSGAGVVLCPLTEAYLGDGLFAAAKFADDGGQIAIGSDSNVCIDVIGELRQLEYGQRLLLQRRACFADSSGIGAAIWSRCADAGGRALGLGAGALEPGRNADLVVLSRDAPDLTGLPPERVLDGWLTAGSKGAIEAVYVGGNCRVAHGSAQAAQGVRQNFGHCMRSLQKRIAVAQG